MGFNTQPPEGGWYARHRTRPLLQSFNTQPPEGGWAYGKLSMSDAQVLFQHTAARRRLALRGGVMYANVMVSTHSRPKAAGFALHQSPLRMDWFQHTAARRRLGVETTIRLGLSCFNTQPPEGGWGKVGIVIDATKSFNTQPPEGGWN